MEERLAQVKVKPKPYLLREPASEEVYSGKLQLCHYLGRRPNAPEVIAKEHSFLWFKDHVEDLVEGLFAVVEKQKKSDERERAREERLEKERQERQAAEHERYLKQQAEAKVREEEMRRLREEAERAAAQKEAEEGLFFNALVKARTLDDCRQVKGYVDEICALAESLEPDVREKILSWADSVRRVIAKKEGWSVDPFSPLPTFDKGVSSDNPMMTNMSHSGCFSSPERNYWANRGWWNKR